MVFLQAFELASKRTRYHVHFECHRTIRRIVRFSSSGSTFGLLDPGFEARLRVVKIWSLTCSVVDG
jgi:hypothetical protein